MKIIGVTPLLDKERDSYWMVPGYMKMLEEENVLPLMLPLTDSKDKLETIISLCDGFLFTGGQDVSPSLYNETAFNKTIPSKERDLMEVKLLKMVLNTDKPVLGICRGIQLLNVVLGGTLYQDIPSQLNAVHLQKPPYDNHFHEVRIKTNSPLHKILNKDIIGVNSLHHQCIKKLSSELVPMAISTDVDIIESVCMPSKPFVWAVQWHPEFDYEKCQSSKAIIKEFINHC